MTPILRGKGYSIINFSQNPAIGGKVLVIGIGGAGIPKESSSLNDNEKGK
ncbi:MAG: hypothetical protein AABY00_03470 [Nanoarchaeota archaeon]